MRYSLESRCRIVRLILDGLSPQAAAAACGASRATGYRLWGRYKQGGWAALADRRSTPRRQPRRVPRAVELEILGWRRRTGYGPLRLAAILELPASTIGKVLRRLGHSRLPRPARDPRVRYERQQPGELLHVDTKRLGRFWRLGHRVVSRGELPGNRGAGWQHLHVAIDDHTRLAYAELLARETASLAPPSSNAPPPGTPHRASGSSASSRTMPRATTPTTGATPAIGSRSGVATPAPTHTGQTGRRKR